ncbi:MAG TPA: hypothetical protein VI384_04275 [Candidatus Dormibacteraeota bacterium]
MNTANTILAFLAQHGYVLPIAVALVALLRFRGHLGIAALALSILNISDNASAGLKDWYSMVYVDAAYRDNVFLGLVNKIEGYGQQIVQSIKIGRTAGHGADISQAITNQSQEARKKFITPWGVSYAVENVDNTEIDVSDSDDGAIVELLGDAGEGCMRKVSEDLEFDMFGDGFGTRGTIASNSGGGPFVLTLAQQMDTIKWQVADIGVSAVANNSASLDTGSFTVTAIDTDAGTLTVTANGGWTPTNNHVIFFTADKKAGSLTTALKVLGLKFWIPFTAPSGVDATGIDRSVDPNKLAGVRIDQTGADPKQAINALLTRICINRSARPDAVFVNPTFYQAYEDSLQNQAVYVRNGGTGEAAVTYFEGIRHIGPRGPVTVYSAPGEDPTLIHACDMSTWLLRSPRNKPIKMAGRAGKDQLIDLATADGIQLRWKYLANLSCSFPGANGVAKVA